MADRQSSDTGSAVSPAPTGLSDEEVDVVLRALGTSVAEFIADTAAAEREFDAWFEEDEQLMEQPRRRGDARRAVVSLRHRVTNAAARELRTSGRELAVWWADLATCAVVAAVTGAQVDPARGAAAEPGRFMGTEDLARLPAASEQDRLLAGLAATMEPSSTVLGWPGYDMPTLARDVAARAGLMMSRTVDGKMVIVDDPSVEGRRRRLWGDVWIDHHLPELPESSWFADVLATAGVAPSVVKDVRSAAAAVADVLAAIDRLEELESAEGIDDSEPAVMDEFDALWARIDPATTTLAAYAEMLTRHLPAIRDGVAGGAGTASHGG